MRFESDRRNVGARALDEANVSISSSDHVEEDRLPYGGFEVAERVVNPYDLIHLARQWHALRELHIVRSSVSAELNAEQFD